MTPFIDHGVMASLDPLGTTLRLEGSTVVDSLPGRPASFRRRDAFGVARRQAAAGAGGHGGPG